jgi:hypothetical protein
MVQLHVCIQHAVNEHGINRNQRKTHTVHRDSGELSKVFFSVLYHTSFGDATSRTWKCEGIFLPISILNIADGRTDLEFGWASEVLINCIFRYVQISSDLKT